MERLLVLFIPVPIWIQQGKTGIWIWPIESIYPPLGGPTLYTIMSTISIPPAQLSTISAPPAQLPSTISIPPAQLSTISAPPTQPSTISALPRSAVYYIRATRSAVYYNIYYIRATTATSSCSTSPIYP